MIKFDPTQIQMTLTDPSLSAQLKDLIVKNPSVLEKIESEIALYLLIERHYDPDFGWYGAEPDRIVVSIPFSVFPKRESAAREVDETRETAQQYIEDLVL